MGEGGCHDPVEEIQPISDINMVLLKRMLLLLLLLSVPVVLQNLVLVVVVLHTVVISILPLSPPTLSP